MEEDHDNDEDDEGFQDDEEIDDLTVTLVQPPVSGQTGSPTSKEPVRRLFADTTSSKQGTQQLARTVPMPPEPSTSYSEMEPPELDPEVYQLIY